MGGIVSWQGARAVNFAFPLGTPCGAAVVAIFFNFPTLSTSVLLCGSMEFSHQTQLFCCLLLPPGKVPALMSARGKPPWELFHPTPRHSILHHLLQLPGKRPDLMPTRIVGHLLVDPPDRHRSRQLPRRQQHMAEKPHLGRKFQRDMQEEALKRS